MGKKVDGFIPSTLIADGKRGKEGRKLENFRAEFAIPFLGFETVLETRTTNPGKGRGQFRKGLKLPAPPTRPVDFGIFWHFDSHLIYAH